MDTHIECDAKHYFCKSNNSSFSGWFIHSLNSGVFSLFFFVFFLKGVVVLVVAVLLFFVVFCLYHHCERVLPKGKRLQANHDYVNFSCRGLVTVHNAGVQTWGTFSCVPHPNGSVLFASFHIHNASIAVRFPICSADGGKIGAAIMFTLALGGTIGIHLAHLWRLTWKPFTGVCK